ncbi:hypothetical protein AAHA92_12549 [Salvia divinorum]|uniref:Uncharacterized protein n=1 Tax=Salvia divinorum TaxID=28513 RepID=A0ABD1HPR2_SALDI
MALKQCKIRAYQSHIKYFPLGLVLPLLLRPPVPSSASIDALAVTGQPHRRDSAAASARRRGVFIASLAFRECRRCQGRDTVSACHLFELSWSAAQAHQTATVAFATAQTAVRSAAQNSPKNLVSRHPNNSYQVRPSLGKRVPSFGKRIPSFVSGVQDVVTK